MTRPSRPALFRDALGGQDGTQAPNLRIAPTAIYWDPTLSIAPRVVPLIARPLPPGPVIIDPSLFVVAPDGPPPPAAQPRAIAPAAPLPGTPWQVPVATSRQRPPAAAPAAIRPAAQAPRAMTAPPPVAWPTPGSSTAWSSSPAVAPVAGTGYSRPALPIGSPTPFRVVPTAGQQPAEVNNQQVLRDAMRAFTQQQRTPQRGATPTANSAAGRTTASAKGCMSAIFWIVILAVVGVLLKSGTFNDLINQIFH